MRKALVFIATFAVVLVAGVAFAFMATPGDNSDEGGEEAKETTTTTTVDREEKDPPKEEPKEEPRGEGEEKVASEKQTESDEKESEEEKSPPEIVILYPEEGQVFEDKRVAFEGEVTPGSEVWAAGYQADVDEEGHWRIVLFLQEGGNLATFTAKKDGLESVDKVKVYLESPKEEQKEEVKEYEFTATQKYGSCGEEVPYDVWYGKGEPGTEIWIGSEFGSNSTVIGADGHWDLKVKFPEAPCGDEFAVVLETSKGHRKVYEFVRWCEDGHEGSDGEHEGEEGGDAH